MKKIQWILHVDIINVQQKIAFNENSSLCLPQNGFRIIYFKSVRFPTKCATYPILIDHGFPHRFNSHNNVHCAQCIGQKKITKLNILLRKTLMEILLANSSLMAFFLHWTNIIHRVIRRTNLWVITNSQITNTRISHKSIYHTLNIEVSTTSYIHVA